MQHDATTTVPVPIGCISSSHYPIHVKILQVKTRNSPWLPGLAVGCWMVWRSSAWPRPKAKSRPPCCGAPLRFWWPLALSWQLLWSPGRIGWLMDGWWEGIDSGVLVGCTEKRLCKMRWHEKLRPCQHEVHRAVRRRKQLATTSNIYSVKNATGQVIQLAVGYRRDTVAACSSQVFASEVQWICLPWAMHCTFLWFWRHGTLSGG